MQCGCNALGSSVTRSECEVRCQYWSHMRRCGDCSTVAGCLSDQDRDALSPLVNRFNRKVKGWWVSGNWIIFLGVINQRPRAARVSLAISGFFCIAVV